MEVGSLAPAPTPSTRRPPPPIIRNQPTYVHGQTTAADLLDAFERRVLDNTPHAPGCHPVIAIFGSYQAFQTIRRNLALVIAQKHVRG